MKNNSKNTHSIKQNLKITRKQALIKAGVTALTAASLIILSTKQGASQSNAKTSKPNRPGRQ